MLPKNYCVPKSETPELTARQRNILSFVLREWSQGCPPTLRMIGSEFGIGSANGVFCHIRALRKKGYLRGDRETRAYAVDLPRPLKILWPGYRLIEERLWAAISRKLLGEAVVELPPVVRYCDELALATEARDLFVGGPVENWTQSLPGPDAATIVPLGMQQARAMFVTRYTSLLLQLGIGGTEQGVA